MKKLITVLALLLTFTVYAEEVKCKIVNKPVGIYYNQCPRDTYTEGADVWAPNNTPYPYLRVACVKPEIICEIVKKDLHKEEK